MKSIRFCSEETQRDLFGAKDIDEEEYEDGEGGYEEEEKEEEEEEEYEYYEAGEGKCAPFAHH